MVCENNLCIYFDNSCCILDSVEMDSLGMCASCVYVDFSEEVLSAERKRLLKKFED